MSHFRYARVPMDVLRELVSYQSMKALELYREVFR